MDPQTILLVIYGISQASQALVELLRTQQNMTPEELQKAWDAQKANLQHAVDLWNTKPPTPGRSQ